MHTGLLASNKLYEGRKRRGLFKSLVVPVQGSLSGRVAAMPVCTLAAHSFAAFRNGPTGPTSTEKPCGWSALMLVSGLRVAFAQNGHFNVSRKRKTDP